MSLVKQTRELKKNCKKVKSSHFCENILRKKLTYNFKEWQNCLLKVKTFSFSILRNFPPTIFCNLSDGPSCL